MVLEVIRDGALPAGYNMAADLFLLSQCAREERLVLRLYGWDRPAVSLGCMQDAPAVLDLAKLAADGGCWVRRPTGGRAVLHDGDLTYSVVFSRSVAALGATVAQTYRLLSDCLKTGLALAGITAQTHDSAYDTRLARSQTRLPCFLAPNRDEIMVNGRKLIGSAQKRTATAVLQHGSIPLTPRFRDIAGYSAASPARQEVERRMLQDKCTCVAEAAPRLTEPALRDALVAGFGRVLEIRTTERRWSDEERAAIDAVCRDETAGSRNR